MLSAFFKAVGDLREPRVRRLLAKSLLLTLLLFAAAAALVGWLLAGSNPCGLGPLDYDCTLGSGGGTLAAMLLGVLGLWLLFPAMAIAVLGWFSDEVVEAVEERHYPASAAQARRPSRARSAAIGLRSGLRLLLWNLAALPFYLVLLVTGIGPFILFFAVNSIALGRDLGEMVAIRRLEGEALTRWLAATRLRRAALGFAVTWLFMIPFANLLAPVIGAAMATHLFRQEGLQR